MWMPTFRKSNLKGCRESEIHSINPAKRADGSVSGIQFLAPGGAYQYDYEAGNIARYCKCREAAGIGLKAAGQSGVWF